MTVSAPPAAAIEVRRRELDVGIGRGRVHELKRLARSGIFAITFVPTLDHSFHVASGRDLAVAALDEWVLGSATGAFDLPGGVTTIS